MINDRKERRVSAVVASLVPRIYGMIRSESVRRQLRRIVLKMEGGAVYSLTIREIFRRFHGVDVGLYTIGPCGIAPGNLPPGTRVGRYCSIYYTVRAFRCDSLNHLSLFPSALNECAPCRFNGGNSSRPRLTIGNDVFIGHNAIILSCVEDIGDGAIIGAGSVVHANVPPYGIVTGNPARLVKFRFSESKIKELVESKWWERDIDDLCSNIEEFQQPLEGTGPIR